MTNLIQLGGSVLINLPGLRPAFAISHSDRSVIDKFQLYPTTRTPEALLEMLFDVLGSRSEMIRRIVVIDSPALPGVAAVRTDDCKAAMVAFSAASGAGLYSVPWGFAKAIAADASVVIGDAIGMVTAAELYRRKVIGSGVPLGDEVRPIDPERQAGNYELHGLINYVKGRAA